MTTRDDEFIGRVEAYLDEYEGVTPLPDTVRDTIRAELSKTKQVGLRRGLMRFIGMNNTMRYGIAAVVIGIAALIGFSFLNNQVGPPTEATPTPSSSASTDLSAGEEAWPSDLQHPFLGPAHDLPDGWSAQQAQLTVSGKRFEYQTWSGSLFLARATVTGSGQLRLVSTSSQGCEIDQQGLYEYTLSPSGNVMTLSGEDECSARAAALGGDWLRSDCKDQNQPCLGNLEAGSYSSAYFEPRDAGDYEPRFGAFTYTVPDGWANASDNSDVYVLTPQSEYANFDGSGCYDCPSSRDLIAVLSDPGAAALDCSESNAEGVGFGVADLVTWLTTHPGLTTSDVQEVTINGRAAVSLTVTSRPDWTGTCDEAHPFVATPLFYRVDSYHWALNSTTSNHVTLIDIGGGHTVAAVVDRPDGAELGAFLDETAPIIATFEFPEG